MRPRLRIHLIGKSVPEKERMAADLRAAVNKRRGRTDFVMVPGMSEVVRERFPVEDVRHFMALESEYLRFEADRDTKAKHLVFVDSIIDRFVRMEQKGCELALYFMPRLRAVASEPGQVFLYGPDFDEERSAFLARNKIHAQLWTGGLDEAVLESVLIALRGPDGR